VVIRRGLTKTSARICEKARDEFGGFHNGILKYSLTNFPLPEGITYGA